MPACIKAAAALMAIILLFCACNPADGPEAAQKPASAPPESEPADRQPDAFAATELVFSLSRDANPTLAAAAEYFCREFSAIIADAVTVRVEMSIAPDADLISGKAHVALLNKKRQLAFNLPLAATAAPFLYNSYQSFTMRANAQSTLSVLSKSLRDESGLIPLAAFYQGGQHMLTNFAAGNYQSFEHSYFAVSGGTDTEAAIKRLGADVVVADDENERFELFADGMVNGAEVSMETLSGAEFTDSSYLTMSYHSIVPAWLIADANLFGGLTPQQQAKVRELCAVMINLIDDEQRAREKALLADFAGYDNLSVVNEFSNVRNRVFNTLPPLDDSAADQQRMAYELLELMRRI